MRTLKDREQFNKPASEQIHKVCLILVHEGDLIFVVRHHAKDNSVSIEPSGGKIEFKENGDKETHGEALIREAGEELGVEIRPHERMLSVEQHPHTKKLVAYYACDHISGTPENALEKEHLGIIEVPIHQIDTYEDLKDLAILAAKRIVEEADIGEELSRPIEFRVPEGAIMNFIQQYRDEPGSAFGNNIAGENLGNSPNPA